METSAENYLETTDGRFRRIKSNLWWDKQSTGPHDAVHAVGLHDDAAVVEHMAANPGVGLIILSRSK